MTVILFTAVATSTWAVLGKELLSAMTLGRRLDIHCTVWQDVFTCYNTYNKKMRQKWRLWQLKENMSTLEVKFVFQIGPFFLLIHLKQKNTLLVVFYFFPSENIGTLFRERKSGSSSCCYICQKSGSRDTTLHL